MQDDRKYDVIVWGATGFTGEMVVAALTGYQDIYYSCKLPNSGKPLNVKFGISWYAEVNQVTKAQHT